MREATGITFRPFDESLRDCVESLLAVAGGGAETAAGAGWRWPLTAPAGAGGLRWRAPSPGWTGVGLPVGSLRAW